MAELSEQQPQPLYEKSPPPKASGALWFGVVTLLIVFSMGGIGFYLLQQLRSQQDNLGGEVNKEDMQLIELSKQISGYQSQLAALSADITAKDNRVTQTLTEFSRNHNEKVDSTRKELTEAVQQLQRQLGKTRGDWLLADAEYLLSVASERLHLVGDVNTSREALEAADQRLRESGDAGAFKVREQIAKELALLNSVSLPDIVGLYGTLQSLEDSSTQLELLLPYAGKALTPAAELSTNETAGVLSALQGVVTVRRVDKAVKTVLTPQEAQFIREQLRVKLEIIKIALVQRNDALFQSSIKDSQQWLAENFAKTTSVNHLASELIKLGNVKIHSQFPDISGSLKMLRDIGKLRLEADKGVLTAPANKSTGQVIELTAPSVSFKAAENTPVTSKHVDTAPPAKEKQQENAQPVGEE